LTSYDIYWILTNTLTTTVGDPFESGTTYHSGVPEFIPDFVYSGRVAHLYLDRRSVTTNQIMMVTAKLPK
jgi:hypothetical protein